MKKRDSYFYYIIVFTLAQIAWFMLLGIWIYWYVSNYIIFEQAGEQLSPQIKYDGINIIPFVGGIILLVSISVGMSLIFRHLNVQLKLYKFYDNFIANVSHELKSPLASIQLYLETLTTRDVPDEKRDEFYEIMTRDSNRLKNLINTILEVSSLERRSISRDYQEYEADGEIKRIITESIEQANLPPECMTIDGVTDRKIVIDSNAMKIVFDNLVDNAKKYSINTPELKVKLFHNLNRLIIEFSDKGIGLPEGEQTQIFKKFHRVYNKDIPNIKGTGLGLFWVKEIMRNHGGHVSARSEGKDKGTTFRLELPAYRETKNRFMNKLLKKSISAANN